MAEIQKVVDQKLVVPFQIESLAGARPSRIVEPVEVRDRRRVGKRRIAHPDPEYLVALDHGEVPHMGLGRNVLLARDVDAIALGVEGEPVIAALQSRLDHGAVGKRRAAVAAPIFVCCSMRVKRPHVSMWSSG